MKNSAPSQGHGDIVARNGKKVKGNCTARRSALGIRKHNRNTVINRRAKYDYALSDDLEVGMMLAGWQVRLIRDHHAQLKGTYVTIRNNELWLLGLTLGSETTENIKLLATRKQITFLQRRKKDGLTIVPTKLLPLKRHIKLIIAVGKGKKEYDKRRSIRARDLDRENR